MNPKDTKRESRNFLVEIPRKRLLFAPFNLKCSFQSEFTETVDSELHPE